MPTKKSTKPTLKATVEAFTAFKEAVRKYVNDVQYPTAVQHSKTSTLFKKGDVTGKAIVSIEELVTTVKAGEVLGYDTILRAGDPGPMGPSLVIYYIKNRATQPVPEGLYA